MLKSFWLKSLHQVVLQMVPHVVQLLLDTADFQQLVSKWNTPKSSQKGEMVTA